LQSLKFLLTASNLNFPKKYRGKNSKKVQRIYSKIGGEIQELKRYDEKNRGRQAKGNQDCVKRP